MSAAARSAGIDRATWTAVENARRKTEEYQYGPLERVLKWAPGSVSRILAGGEPAPLPDAEAAAPPDDRAARIIWESDLPREEKLRWIERLLDERDLAERRRAELAREAVRTWERAREAK